MRHLPSDPEAEQAVVGALVLEPQLYLRVSGIVRPEDFYESANRTIYEAVTTLIASGFPVDQTSVVAQCRALDARFDPVRVLVAAESVALPSSAPHHARMVARLGAQRAVILAASEAIEHAQADDRSPEQIVAEAAARLQEVPGLSMEEESPTAMTEASLAELEEEARTTPHIPTGIPTLDRMLGGGLAPRRLYLVGARASVGKSAFVTNIARGALDAGLETLVVSLEMTGREVLTRLVADAYGVDPASTAELMAGMMNDRTLAWPMRFLGYADLAGILAAVYRRRPRLVIVDYLQLVPTNMRFERRDLEIAHITRSLKLLAVRAEVPVLACAQVNRAPAKANRAPLLSDLRESGAQEMDADVVMLLDRDVDEAAREARLAIAKNRQGATGTVSLVFDAVRTRFRELHREIGAA